MRGLVRQRGTTWAYLFAVTEGVHPDVYPAGHKLAGEPHPKAGQPRRRQIQRGGYRLKSEAQTALTEALAAYGKGDKRATVQPSVQPLGQYLDAWLERRQGLKPGTRESYETVIRAWIKPHVGDVALRDLTGERLQRLYATLERSGGKGGRALGSRSVQYAHRVLTMALSEAVESGALARSPIADIPRRQRPTHTAARVEERVWTAEEAATFLRVTDTERLHPMWATALDTGARRGELCALRWVDVDLEGAVATIRKNLVIIGGEVVEGETKSGKARKVSLDENTVAILKRWKARQAGERLAWGEAWTDSGRVFTREDGAAVHPEAVSTAFERTVSPMKVPTIRLHDLRHTSGTLALAAGVPPQVVQERLGHADIATTLRLYAHVLPTQQSDAAARIGAAIYGRKVG